MPIKKYVVELEPNDLLACNDATKKRIELIKQNGYQHRTPQLIDADDPYNEAGHYRSFVTELAAARYFGVQYSFDIGPDQSRTDLINGCQIRSRSKPYQDLIVRPYDKPAPFVLAIVLESGYEVLLAGWRDLVDCRLEKYWGGDAWWIPQHDLHDMVSLKARFMLV